MCRTTVKLYIIIYPITSKYNIFVISYLCSITGLSATSIVFMAEAFGSLYISYHLCLISCSFFNFSNRLRSICGWRCLTGTIWAFSEGLKYLFHKINLDSKTHILNNFEFRALDSSGLMMMRLFAITERFLV